MALSSTNTDNYESNVDAAAEVFAKHGDFIHTAIRYLVNNETQADDLFQDFFLSLVSKPLPPNLRNIKGYLYRSIKNDFFAAIRRTKNRQDRVQEHVERRKYRIIQEDPENIVIRAEEAEKMLQKIDLRLCKHEAEVIVQRYVYSRGIADMAEKMHVDKRTVSQYLSLAMKKLCQFIPKNEMIFDDLP